MSEADIINYVVCDSQVKRIDLLEPAEQEHLKKELLKRGEKVKKAVEKGIKKADNGNRTRLSSLGS